MSRIVFAVWGFLSLDFPLLRLLVYTYTEQSQAGLWNFFRPYMGAAHKVGTCGPLEKGDAGIGASTFYHGGTFGAAWLGLASRDASASLSSPGFSLRETALRISP